MRLPRDLDIQSGAFVLFAFVVILSFSLISMTVIGCRVFGKEQFCYATTPEAQATIRDYVKNIIDILLALMAGGARKPAPPPPPEPRDHDANGRHHD